MHRDMEKTGVVLPQLSVPAPVFMCSVEPYSSGDYRKLDFALQRLTKEDPSLR